MASTELEVQPVQDRNTEEMETQTGDLIPEQAHRPTEKSGVDLNRDPPTHGGRFEKYDPVHMSVSENGRRRKRNFEIGNGRLNPQGRYWEYQLVDEEGRSYLAGAWFRERELRAETRPQAQKT